MNKITINRKNFSLEIFLKFLINKNIPTKNITTLCVKCDL